MGRAAKNGQPMSLTSVTATKPPSMAKAQCARLMKFIMPSVTDNPTDRTNSSTPKAKPSNRTLKTGGSMARIVYLGSPLARNGRGPKQGWIEVEERKAAACNCEGWAPQGGDHPSARIRKE